MLRRCRLWDYHDPRIYMITITLADRSQPLLGDLVVTSPAGCAPEEVKAYLSPSQLGMVVQEFWNSIPRIHPQIRLLGFQLMEEHLHGILHVTARMPRPLGNVIGGFKAVCTAAYRKLFPLAANQPLFSEGFQDTLLSRQGQLAKMKNYLRDNPRRSAVKRLFPDFFRQLRRMPFGTGAFTGIGNSFLLEHPCFYQVQASRRITPEEFARKQQEMLLAIEEKAVVVSPCISPAERELAHLAFDRQAPLIVLQNKGFAKLYKPPGAYFDACAAGRLLMLAPSQWPFVPGKKPMTRADACVLNALAQQICKGDATEIHYQGNVP
ncbi:MAG: hypothetical protein J6Y80_02770, partial [Victivallales bacterium]|nr:hypothetical protein [Victivallales bacterium]